MTCRVSITGLRRAVLTAMLAYALVLQALSLSLSGALHAAEAAGAQGILCLQDDRSIPDHAPDKAHDGLCCTFSCHASGAVGPVPATALIERLVPVAVDVGAPADASTLHLSSNVLPVGSRAPPRLG